MGDFDGLVAVVTGNASGIGAATAALLASRGATVAGLDVTTGCDVTSSESVDAGIAAVVQEHGRIDVVVNNAGILRDQIFHKMTVEDWRAVIDVHLNGSFYVSRAAAEHFRKQGGGAFVHMTSTSGLIGNFGQANYAAAKLGVAALSKSIALDMQRFGVRSNCIAPFAWSRMTSSIPAETEAEKARVARLQQMTPDKNAPLAVFLASDAAKDVTGQIFAARHNELFVFSQPRPVRSTHRGEGWTPEAIAEVAMPALRAAFVPLDRSGDVFSWDPV
jgi:NAD(P)-dependent dehydrogenase (short-subunit alcohol dehydrogenase family)